MKKNLQERYARYDARFPMNEVYLSLPRAVRNDAYLYLLALSGHQRANEADENVPLTIAEAIAQSMGVKAERMIAALESVKKDGQPRVLARFATHLRLAKYSKWQDLPDEIAELKAKRSSAGKLGGLNSARAAKGQANAVADAQALADDLLPEGEAKLKQTSSKPQAEREREVEREVSLYGDKVTSGAAPTNGASPWATTSVKVLAGHVGGWFLVWKQWSSVKPETRRQLDADSLAMAELGIPGEQLHADLEELASRHDPDDVHSLGYFRQPVQELQNARLKQQGRPQARTEGLTRAGATLPDLSHAKGKA